MWALHPPAPMGPRLQEMMRAQESARDHLRVLFLENHLAVEVHHGELRILAVVQIGQPHVDRCLGHVALALGDAAGRIAARVQQSGECWFGPTVWRGRPAIRISVSSHATTSDDVRRSLDAIAAATEADRSMSVHAAVDGRS